MKDLCFYGQRQVLTHRRPIHTKGENEDFERAQKGLPLSIRPGHTIRLEVTKEPLTATREREDVAIRMAIGRKDIHDPTTAGDFCRRFSPGHIFQMNKAFREIGQNVYRNRTDVTPWTIDVDVKCMKYTGKRKKGHRGVTTGYIPFSLCWWNGRVGSQWASFRKYASRCKDGGILEEDEEKNTHPGKRRYTFKATLPATTKRL